MTTEQQQENVINSLVQALAHMGADAIEKAISGLIFHRHDAGVKTQTEGCNGVAMPTQPPSGHHLGHWTCTKDGWVWEDEIG